MVACLVILIPLGIYQVQVYNYSPKLPSDDTTQNRGKMQSKKIAENYLTRHQLTVQSYYGQKTVKITQSLLKYEPIVIKGLETIGANVIDHSLEIEGNSLMNKNITLETFSITGSPI